MLLAAVVTWHLVTGVNSVFSNNEEKHLSMTLAPSEREYLILFITFTGPGAKQMNRTHTHRTEHFFYPRTLLRNLISHTFMHQRLIEISTQLFPHYVAFEAQCRESRQIGFPALSLGINMILLKIWVKAQHPQGNSCSSCLSQCSCLTKDRQGRTSRYSS